MDEHLTDREYTKILIDRIEKGFKAITDRQDDARHQTQKLEHLVENLQHRVDEVERKVSRHDRVFDENGQPVERRVRASDGDPLTRRDLNVAIGVGTAVAAFFKWVVPLLKIG